MEATQTVRNRVSQNSRVKIFVTVSGTIFYGLIIYFIRTTHTAIKRSEEREPLNALLKINESVGLTVLRVMQGIISLASMSAINGALELLQWSLASRPQGLSYVTFLIFSPATGILGALGIFISWSPIKVSDRLWAIVKCGSYFFIWLAALLLFVNTSTVIIHDRVTTFDVTAGYGPFNASYVDSFFEDFDSLSSPSYPYQILPYTTYGTVNNLVVNPTQSTASTPISCKGDACDSYFLSGGILMATPWVASMHGGTEHPIVMIDRLPGVQLDFDATPAPPAANPTPNFNLTTDCTTYGGAKGPGNLDWRIAILLCIKLTPDALGLKAGLFVCQDGTTPSGACNTTYPTPNITTTLHMHTRSATILATTHNFSILHTTDLSSPKRSTIDPRTALPAYKRVLSWLLDFNATNIPAPSSIAQSFWSSGNILASPDASVSNTILKQNFQSILAFPIWIFNANNYGNVDLQESEMVSNLPEEFYTDASIVVSYDKMMVNEDMFVWFVVLQGVVLVLVWGILGWVWWVGIWRVRRYGRQEGAIPVNVSSYVLFDCAMKMVSVTEGEVGRDGLGGDSGGGRWMDLNDKGVLKFAVRSRVYVTVPGQVEGSGQEGLGGGMGIETGSEVRRQKHPVVVGDREMRRTSWI